MRTKNGIGNTSRIGPVRCPLPTATCKNQRRIKTKTTKSLTSSFFTALAAEETGRRKRSIPAQRPQTNDERDKKIMHSPTLFKIANSSAIISWRLRIAKKKWGEIHVNRTYNPKYIHAHRPVDNPPPNSPNEPRPRLRETAKETPPPPPGRQKRKPI